jgi:hypothetical protein
MGGASGSHREKCGAYRVLGGRPEEEDLGVDGSIILKCIFRI